MKSTKQLYNATAYSLIFSFIVFNNSSCNWTRTESVGRVSKISGGNYINELKQDSILFNYTNSYIKKNYFNEIRYSDKIIFIRLFTMGCEKCIGEQIRLINEIKEKLDLPTVWLITSNNIREFQIFISKYKISENSQFLPFNVKFSYLDKWMENYFVTISNKMEVISFHFLEKDLRVLDRSVLDDQK